MTKQILIGAAMAAVLITAGVVVGRQGDAPVVVAPVASPGPAPAAAPTLQGRPADGRLSELITRVERLEHAVESMRRAQDELGKRLEPAAALVALLSDMRPRLKTARKSANQTAAIATMRNFISAQAQIQASGKIDRDQDGTGEYAGFYEMSGAGKGRMASVLVPPVLSSAFRTLNANGDVMRSGYHYRLFLPDAQGGGIGEPGGGFDTNTGVEADLAETTWCCYAWPVNSDASGARVFFTNQAGDVLATETPNYVGSGGGPAADAAFLDGNILSRVAIGARGRDGNFWKQDN